jgi:hypothetical protein
MNDKTKYLWIGIALFVLGFLIGSFCFPHPRYTFYHFQARDTWTGGINQRNQP